MKVSFFRTPSELRKWLEKNHARRAVAANWRRSSFAEKKIFDSTQYFFDANRPSEKTIAAENAAGDHLALRLEAAQPK